MDGVKRITDEDRKPSGSLFDGSPEGASLYRPDGKKKKASQGRGGDDKSAGGLEGEIGGWPGEEDRLGKDKPEPSFGGGDATEDTPEIKRLVSAMTKAGDPAEKILIKDPKSWTRDEWNQVKGHWHGLNTNDPRYQTTSDKLGEWTPHFYGDGPVQYDATGRMLTPQPIRPIPTTPTPARDADGVDIDASMKNFAQWMADNAKTAGGSASSVKDTQDGQNQAARIAAGRWPPDNLLKVDGVLGPKTRSSIFATLADKGTAQAKMASALGGFHNRVVAGAKRDQGDLDKTTESIFGSLFRGSEKLPQKAPRRESYALQDTLNELGPRYFTAGKRTPLKRDGVIGPKTKQDFGRVAWASEPNTFSVAFGKNLGLR